MQPMKLKSQVNMHVQYLCLKTKVQWCEKISFNGGNMTMMMATSYQEVVALPKIVLPARPFLIRYMAQDRGPEPEKAPGFML